MEYSARLGLHDHLQPRALPRVRPIESVLSQQTSFDFELVLGDDCSTDG